MIYVAFYISLFINFCLICEYMRSSLIAEELQKELGREKELGRMLESELEKARENEKEHEGEKEKKDEGNEPKIKYRTRV
ncbi:MAG: hypothetical protein E3K37_16060 [Candidatus Kuenenia sp.]|nr:hypothetical protein [Candidatus Kuenenia hertensis]